MRTILGADAHRRRSYVTFGSLVLAAWLALAAWSLSPYAVWLDHARIEDIAAPPTARLAVFTLGWALMIIAMMLPGTLLLLSRCLGNNVLGARRIAPVILAYLAVWTVFGSLSYLGDSVLHEIVEQVPTLAGVIAPCVLLLAGFYQFTPIKRVSLSRCRPESAALNSLGQSGLCSPWTAGARHGAFCVGSCWALMLLMFAIGGVNLVSMLVLGTVMAAERTINRGALLTQLLGCTLIVCSFLVMLR